MTKIKLRLREVVAIVICLVGTAAIFAQEETGVVINGVMWATRNVDAVGTFAKNSGSFGMFYKWNDKKTCPVGNVTDRDTVATWETVNDPSPYGWRVPTRAEIRKLLDIEKVEYEWTTENGVWGGRFTDKATGKSIFLPGTPWQDYNGTIVSFDSTSDNEDVYGYYWSSDDANGKNAYHLYFRKSSLKMYHSYYGFCFSIRPVKNFTYGTDEISSNAETVAVTGYLDFWAEDCKMSRNFILSSIKTERQKK